MDTSPLYRAVMCGTLGTADSIDAAVHDRHPDPIPGGVEGGSLAPLVGHGVVAAQVAWLCACLKRQVPASNLGLQKWGIKLIQKY